MIYSLVGLQTKFSSTISKLGFLCENPFNAKVNLTCLQTNKVLNVVITAGLPGP